MTPMHRRKLPGGVPSAHVDGFAREMLPPPEQWPAMDYSGIPELDYPDHLNVAVALLDGASARGWGERVAFRSPSESVTYAELLERSPAYARLVNAYEQAAHEDAQAAGETR